MKKVHEHSYCTETTIFHTVAGKEVWDITCAAIAAVKDNS
jgi:hypothetical protein